MKLEDAILNTNCEECEGMAQQIESPDEFGLYNGHIFNVKATFNLDMPCLCGAPASGLQKEKKNV